MRFKPISVTTDSTAVIWFTSFSSINFSSDLSSTAMLGDGPARLLLEEDKIVFRLWLATLPGKTDAPRFPPSLSSYLARLVADPLSFQIVHQCQTWRWYCLRCSEKRTVPPFGLWSAHPSLKFDWKGSLPCLSIALVLSSSERVRDENFSTSLVWVCRTHSLYVVQQIRTAPRHRQIWMSRHMLVLGIPTLVPIHSYSMHRHCHARFHALLSEWNQNSPVLLWNR